MPYTPDSPNSENIPGPPVSQGLNKLHILRMDIQLKPGDPDGTVIDVLWAEGYRDGDDFKPVKQNQVTLSGEALATKLNEATTGGSHYGEVKNAVWELLQSEGHVGAGTIS